MRLTGARASGGLSARFDAFLDRVAAELDTARSKAGGVRGEARAALLTRLAEIDAEMLLAARDSVGQDGFQPIIREAEEELASFRAGMSAETYERARMAAAYRLLRERLRLPTVLFE